MNEDMGDGLGPEPCQPIGCDADIHLPGCVFDVAKIDLGDGWFWKSDGRGGWYSSPEHDDASEAGGT